MSEQEIAKLLRPLAAQIAADTQLLDEDFDAHAPAFGRQTVASTLISTPTSSAHHSCER